MRLGIRNLAGSFTALVLLFGCTTTEELSARGVEISQTPVTENSTGEVHPGKFVWHDLLTTDPALAGKFYENLFGWSIDYEGDYAVIRNKGKLIAGILHVKSEEGSSTSGVWMPSVSVEDVDLAVGLVKENGGRVLKGPVDMHPRGRAALVSDTQQSDIVLLAVNGGDPVDEEVDIGSWLWDEIWTNDPDAVEQFYSRVLGYDETETGDDYAVFVHDGKWRAGIRYVKKEFEQRLWVPVVRVVDPYYTVIQVKDLGGMVWVPPGTGPANSDTALIADPTGALILVQRWTSIESAGEL